MRRLSSSLFPALAATLTVLALCACATVKRFTPDFSQVRIPMPSMPDISMPKLPKISLPTVPLPTFSSLKKITHIIPGMPGTDKAAEDDPKMPFNARGTLGYGHTVRVHVYEGARSQKRIYNGVVMVDSKGILDFGRPGMARVGGSALPQAADIIASTFRFGLGIARPVTVHILSVEDVPVVSVTGDVVKDEFVPAWQNMTIKQAVMVAGGRRTGSTAQGVYVIREGAKRFYRSLEDADQAEPEPGDIITLSPDI